MKHTILAFSLSIFLVACGGSSNNSTTATQTDDQSSTSASEPAESSTKGEQLISSSDCMACHRVNEKIIGPSYTEVARKYENTDANIEILAGKIIEGGAGNWGDVPMTPHPGISKDDAREMVKYIFTLK